MEEKTIIGLCAMILLALLQAVAWVIGYNGAITQLVGSGFGLIIGYYFARKINHSEGNIP